MACGVLLDEMILLWGAKHDTVILDDVSVLFLLGLTRWLGSFG